MPPRCVTWFLIKHSDPHAMSNSTSRVLNAVSTAELERRWRAVRDAMRAPGIDALVVQNSSDWVGGMVRWFTDIPATNGYPRTVIFHADGTMTVIEMGPFESQRIIEHGDPLIIRAYRRVMIEGHLDLLLPVGIRLAPCGLRRQRREERDGQHRPP